MLPILTVKELIAALQEQDADGKVIFASDYGDRFHTSQALPILGVVTEVVLRPTAYSVSGHAVVEPDEDREIDPTKSGGDLYLLIT